MDGNSNMTAVLAFVPAYKNQLTGTTLLTTHALANGLRQRGIEWGISSISNPDVEWVRNWALTHWYDKLPRYSHILFIDDDMGFMPDLVLDMLAFGEPVVGGLYPKKTADRQWAVSGLPRPQMRGPYIECEGIGAGCLLIRRDAITTMLEKMPELSDTRPHTIDSALFREAEVTRLIRAFDKINDPARGTVSEDISFGRRWRDCGGQVWAATHHKIVHVGPYEFADTYSEWSEKQKVASVDRASARIGESELLKANPVLRGVQAKHGILIYNPNDTFIGRSVEAYGEWSEFEIEFLARFIQEGQTVIDVGANIGTHTLAFSNMVGKHGKVFSFEAQPRLEAILAENIKLNNLGNVYWDCQAVGETVGTIILPDMPPDTEASNFGNFPLHPDRSGPGVSAKMTTIDAFAGDGDAFGISPTLIKIDVEGMEALVIQGAVGTIHRCRPVLYLDFGEGARQDIWGALNGVGYVGFWHLGPFFNPGNALRNPVNIWQGRQVLGANMVCVLREDADDNIYQQQLAGLERYAGPDDTWKLAMERLSNAHRLKQAAE
jgi:FkbM family methyltransferase